jgi:catechol 2,3-dioxygenase-like lactoylglutathione lyase family enzyme
VTVAPWQGQLSTVGLGCPDLEAMRRFYEDALGLSLHGERPDGTLLLGWGSGDPILELSAGEPGLVDFGIEVPNARELEALLAALDRAGVPADGDGFTRDPEGRSLRLHGRIDRSGEHTSDPGRRPIRMQHITFATTQMDELLDFYAGTLGFRISDRVESHFVWLRCGREHHTIAMVAGEGPRGLDHYSYDVDGWPDYKIWCDRLSVLGIPVRWGPGRHGPGNNLFIMFDDPSGVHVELSAELELFWDDRAEIVPRRWEQTDRTVNLWGPGPDWRR